MPTPLSSTTRRTARFVLRDADRDRTSPGRGRATLRTASCAPRNTSFSTSDAASNPGATSTSTVISRAVSEAARSASAASSPSVSKLGGWISTMSERSSRMLVRTPTTASSRYWRVSCRGAVGRRSEAAARLYAVPARRWTTPSCRSAAMRRRSRSVDSTALTSSRPRSTCPRRSCRASNHVNGPRASHSSSTAPVTMGAIDTQTRRPPAAKPVKRVYDSTSTRCPAGVSTATSTSRSFPRPRSEACSGDSDLLDARLCAQLLQRGQIAGVERVPLADQLRQVGVDDPPVGIPDLQADDVLVEHPFPYDTVQCGEGGGVAVDCRVGEQRSDDAPADQHGRLARVVDGLVPALALHQIERRPSDEDHGGEADGHEPRDRAGCRRVRPTAAAAGPVG